MKLLSSFGCNNGTAVDSQFVFENCVDDAFDYVDVPGQVIAQDLNDDEEFFDTPEGPATMDNTFMGYAIAVGHFNNDDSPGNRCSDT